MKPSIYSIHYKQQGVIWQLSTVFLEQLPFHDPELTFVCIGTDRSTGDTLGPLVGSFLSLYKSFPFRVVGSLEQPVHALNLQDTVEHLHHQRPTAPMVAIDACLGKARAVGDILVEKGPLWPGKAVQKTLPPVGDHCIKAIVNHMSEEGLETLQSTRLNVTHDLARVIANSLFLAWHRYLATQQMSMQHIEQQSVDSVAN